jgi:hypothetical protein
MFRDDLIQQCLFGMAGLVGGGKAHAPGPCACQRPTSRRDPVGVSVFRTDRHIRNSRDNADRRFPDLRAGVGLGRSRYHTHMDRLRAPACGLAPGGSCLLLMPSQT